MTVEVDDGVREVILVITKFEDSVIEVVSVKVEVEEEAATGAEDKTGTHIDVREAVSVKSEGEKDNGVQIFS